MTGFIRDFRAGVRLARRAPVVSLGGILCIALGIGGATALYDVLDRIVLHPLAYPKPHELVLLRATNRAKNIIEAPISHAEFGAWRQGSTPFDGLVAYQMGTVSLSGADVPERLDAERVSDRYFALLGIAPILGRTLGAADTAADAAPAAVISEGVWRRQFQADPAVVGRAVRINGRAVTIVGVMPAAFRDTYGLQPDCWLPLAFDNPALQRPDARTLVVIARLSPTTGLAAARSAMAAWTSAGAPGPDAAAADRWTIDVVPLVEQAARGWKAPAVALFVVVALVLIIACINVATLLLARTAERDRELALRIFLGAGTWPIVRQFVAETLVLVLPGVAAGVACAYALQRLLIALRPAFLSRLDLMGLDWPVLLATVASLTATVALCTSPPLWHALRGPRQNPLRGGTPGVIVRESSQRSLTVLTVMEIALGLALLVVATSVMRDVVARLPGEAFDWRDKLTIRLTLPADRYATREERLTFLNQAADRLRALPGVTAVAEASIVPFDRYNLGAFVTSPGSHDTSLANAPATNYALVSPTFFSMLRMRIVAGRAFGDQDVHGATVAFIVTESVAKRLWPGQDPLHQPLSVTAFNSTGSLRGDVKREGEVVGVVADPPNPSSTGAQLLVYAPIAQHTVPFTRFIIAAPRARALARDVRREVSKIDPALVPDEVGSLEEMLGQRLELSRFYMVLTQLFAVVGVALAAVGVFAVTSYGVSRRRRELAVRAAVGASPGQIFARVVVPGIGILLAGLVAGGLTAFLARHLMSALIVGATANDPATFGLAALGVTVVAGVALLVGALRAMRLDPIRALREP